MTRSRPSSPAARRLARRATSPRPTASATSSPAAASSSKTPPRGHAGSAPRSFTAQPHTRARGRAAEDAAAAWLEARGYQLLARNHDTLAGEIDAVALDAVTLCFIEIKARDSDAYGSPLAAVGRRKQQRLGRAAALYLAENPWDGPCRFDVLGMTGGGESWRFELVRDAFELS